MSAENTQSPVLLVGVDLSIIIPTINEAGNIRDIITGITQVVSGLGITAEIIVIDGNSSDNTVELARYSGARTLLQRRPGYGGALREGLAAARGEFVICLDADHSHPPELIRLLWETRSQADIVIASRFVAGSTFSSSPWRKLLSHLLSRLCRRALSIPVWDFSSGYRLYRRSALMPDLYSSENFEILLEILVRAFCEGYSVKEIPLNYGPRGAGSSKAQVLRFGANYLQVIHRMWKIRNSVESADYDSRAYDSVIPLQRYWQRRRYAIVKGYLGESPGAVLDIGCGSSRIIQSLPNAVAMDIQERKLRFLRSTNPYRVRASTFALPFASKAFDSVIHSQVLEHIPEDQVIYTELNRVIKLGGKLIAGTPDYGRPWWPITEFFYKLILPNAYADEHITHYTRKSLCDHLASAGFRVAAYRYICGGELIVSAVKVEDLPDEKEPRARTQRQGTKRSGAARRAPSRPGEV